MTEEEEEADALWLDGGAGRGERYLGSKGVGDRVCV